MSNPHLWVMVSPVKGRNSSLPNLGRVRVGFGNVGSDEGGFAKAGGGGDQGEAGAGQGLQPIKESRARD